MQGPLSPDGLYRWDGTRWVPTGAWMAPARAPMISRPAPQAPGFWPALAGGITAIVGAVAVIGACLLPYAFYTDSSGAQTSPSIINSGFAGGGWFAAEPVAVSVLAIGAGVMLLTWRHRLARALAAGALLAFGIQTFFLFAGYIGSGASQQGGEIGPGAVVGVLAGLVILGAGVSAGVSVGSRVTGAPA